MASRRAVSVGDDRVRKVAQIHHKNTPWQRPLTRPVQAPVGGLSATAATSRSIRGINPSNKSSLPVLNDASGAGAASPVEDLSELDNELLSDSPAPVPASSYTKLVFGIFCWMGGTAYMIFPGPLRGRIRYSIFGMILRQAVRAGWRQRMTGEDLRLIPQFSPPHPFRY